MMSYGRTVQQETSLLEDPEITWQLLQTMLEIQLRFLLNC